MNIIFTPNTEPNREVKHLSDFTFSCMKYASIYRNLFFFVNYTICSSSLKKVLCDLSYRWQWNKRNIFRGKIWFNHRSETPSFRVVVDLWVKFQWVRSTQRPCKPPSKHLKEWAFSLFWAPLNNFLFFEKYWPWERCSDFGKFIFILLPGLALYFQKITFMYILIYTSNR